MYISFLKSFICSASKLWNEKKPLKSHHLTLHVHNFYTVFQAYTNKHVICERDLNCREELKTSFMTLQFNIDQTLTWHALLTRTYVLSVLQICFQ